VLNFEENSEVNVGEGCRRRGEVYYFNSPQFSPSQVQGQDFLMGHFFLKLSNSSTLCN
jgi:hypothetical protein